MTAKIFLLIFTIVISFFVFSCKKENKKNNQLSLTGELVNHSECKNKKKLIKGSSEIPDSISCIDYSFDEANNKLTIKHINAGFNCCPDSLYCDVILNNDTIMIQEFEKDGLCNCDCLYDLNIEIIGVASQKYYIKIDEPYRRKQAELSFKIDLTKNKAGSYCVIRNQYPWGI